MNVLCEQTVMTVANNKSTTEEVLAFYEAYYQLLTILNSESNVVNIHLLPGQIIMIHNTRVFHGRKGFEMSSEPGGSRWLRSAYYEWDMVFSKLRVLQKRLGLITPRIYTDSNEFF